MYVGFRKSSIALFGLLGLLCLRNAAAEGDLPSVLDLQRSYVEANGGLANIQDLSSIIASGVILDTEGNEQAFKLYRKRPDMMRIQVDLPGGSQQTIFDGSQAFKIFSKIGGETEIVDLDSSETEQLRVDSTMDGPFYHLRGRPEWLEVLAAVEVDGQAAYEITIHEDANSPYDKLWIGKEHFQEVKLSRQTESGTGGLETEQIYFSDFEQIRGVWLAKTIRYEREGTVTQTVQIERVRANVGVFDSVFRRPKD